jgi:hypothetical protein
MRLRIDRGQCENIRRDGEKLLEIRKGGRVKTLHLIPVRNENARKLFDRSLDILHYAGSCQRVGRCIRLAIIRGDEWVGGVVLGSTFPNIAKRDEAFGLDKFLRNTRDRGLVSPFASENNDYWENLQKIVNHARTFIFPAFQGKGIGVKTHALLLTEGRRIWESKYGSKILGFDTLCTHPKSRLFLDNDWILVGRTQGYTRDPKKVLSSRKAFLEEWDNIKENAGLGRLVGSHRWWIWVKVLQKC